MKRKKITNDKFLRTRFENVRWLQSNCVSRNEGQIIHEISATNIVEQREWRHKQQTCLQLGKSFAPTSRWYWRMALDTWLCEIKMLTLTMSTCCKHSFAFNCLCKNYSLASRFKLQLLVAIFEIFFFFVFVLILQLWNYKQQLYNDVKIATTLSRKFEMTFKWMCKGRNNSECNLIYFVLFLFFW